MKKYTLPQIFIFTFMLLSLLACKEDKKPESNDKKIEKSGKVLSVKELIKNNPKIKLGRLESRSLSRYIPCTGMLELPPNELISIHSRTEGFVESINYLPGDFVRAGALLVRISNPQLIEKQRVLMETKAELETAQRDYNRKKSLRLEEATSEKLYNETSGKRNFLLAKYNGLKSELAAVGINVKLLETKQNFQSTIGIYASKSGYISNILINKGQMVQPQTKLMDLVDTSHTHMTLDVLSKDVSFLKLGQKVTFTLPNNPKVFTASIFKISPMLDSQKGVLSIHCHIKEENNPIIKAGTYVNATIESENQKVYGLPMEAVLKEGENYFVYGVEKDRITKIQLKNALVQDDFLLIDPNQNPLNEIIISGAYYIGDLK